MTSVAKTGAYGDIAPPAASTTVPLPLPIQTTLKDGTPVILTQVNVANEESATLATLQSMLNHEIAQGDTYPHEFEMDEVAFKAYFLSGSAFMLTDLDRKTIMGTFYVKPNYPGRCSEICNGGFITHKDWRGKGVGKILGKAFLVLAPKLGYKGSVFNLVFETNVASVNLWRSLGFHEVGRIPKAGRLKGHGQRVTAIVFHYDFETLPHGGYTM
ncbi:hypothetical protein BC830DRAFT_1146593 [Chytriomyces sp. MP71]|nr:hypothetical protein BC830DRAFT_1146593 [Chytriomyces sp. MP71]